MSARGFHGGMEAPLLDEKHGLPLIEVKRIDEEVSNRVHNRRHSTLTNLTWRLPLFLLGLAAIYALHNTYTPHHSWLPNHDTHNPTTEHTSPSSNFTCLPGQPCWPSTKQWHAFNQSIAGHLRITVPWAAPCYTNASSPECHTVSANYMEGTSRSSHYGAMEFINWEACGQSHCHLDSFSPSSPVDGVCSLGRMSTYHVEAHTANDISATLRFVRKHGIRVSIKNTGHDYFGRSNAANSLAIWTHKMKDTKYHRRFRPKGCKARYENIGEIGAGIQAQEAWEFFEPLDMMVTVGAVGSVGIAGGFGQGGGHGPLGPKYGLMVDQAVEFDVVTADGKHRTINECSDPDLFWAMRGGGGGTYAVLTSYKFQLHPAVPLNVYSVQAHFALPDDLRTSRVHRDIVSALAANQSLFAENGVAGYNFLLPNHIVLLQILPSHNTSALRAITAQFHAFLTSHPDLNITDASHHTFATFSHWHTFTQNPAIARNGPVGLGLAESARFIPAPIFRSAPARQKLVDAVLDTMHFSHTHGAGGSVQVYATGPNNHADNSKTGLNPAWRDSLWHVLVGGVWTSRTPQNERVKIQDTVSRAMKPFKEMTPGGGCYVNEGDWQEKKWEEAFFGTNYARLLAVKRRFDPRGVFECWKCVGWRGEVDPIYSCYGQGREMPVPSVPLGSVG